MKPADDRGDIISRGVTKLACDERAVGVARTRSLEGLGADIAQAIAQIDCHLVGTVDADLPEHADDLDQHGEEVDAGEAGRFEPCLKLVDMTRPQRLDTGDRFAGLGKVGEELGHCVRICLHGRSGAERPAWRSQVAKSPRDGQSEAARLQRDKIDERLTAVLRGDREAQARDRIGIARLGDASVAAEGDPATLAGTAAHDAVLGTSDRSSSTAASTVSARAAT